MLHVVFLSFQQKEVRSWVVSLANVVHPFIRVPLVCDCSPSCSPPALHPSASPQLRNQLWLAKSTLHQQSSRPWRETLPSIPLGPPCLRQESQGQESRGELIENRFLSALPG